jgi:sigma-B regulation protein RsbU (phosphoserine phosphatase)
MALPAVDELYDAAPCGFLLAARDGTLLHGNATICRWLGYDAVQVATLRLNDLMTMGGRIFFHTHLQPLLRIQGSVSEVKLEIRAADGRLLPMILNIVERTADSGSLMHIAAFIAEDRHKYERELVLQRQRAEELAALHAKDQQEISAARKAAEVRARFAEELVGVVSHDIRNPLSVIHMSTVLLDRGVAPDQQKAVVGRISRAVARVQHLVTDLLDFTQARLGGGLRVVMTHADLHRAVADAVSELKIAFPRHELVYLQHGEGNCRADPDRITQAIGNLVANAANHGAAGQPITVRAEGSGDRFLITVHNHGTPIPPDLVPKLFEPMVRGVEGSTTAAGVGLGLYIVRAIVHAHGGTVHATSTAEDGTSFVIDLPRHAASARH